MSPAICIFAAVVIVLLLLAIIAALGGAQAIMSGLKTGLGAIACTAVWIALGYSAGHVFGGWGIAVVVSLPFAAMVGASMYIRLTDFEGYWDRYHEDRQL